MTSITTIGTVSAEESSDARAVRRSLSNPEAFAEVFDRHFVTVHRYLHRRAGRDVADELAGETFRIAFEQRDRWSRSTYDARPWLLGIATNLVRRRFRTEQRRLRAIARTGIDDWASLDEAAVAERADARSSRRRLARGLAALSPDDRDVLVLVAFAELTYDEVAEALGIPSGTVASPTDPKGEGGHCMSAAGNRKLKRGETVVFRMSGGSVGGYAPGAAEVHLSGAGIDETVPVGDNGWWLGVVDLPIRDLAERNGRAEVFAATVGPDGETVARLPLICMEKFDGAPGIYGMCRQPLILD